MISRISTLAVMTGVSLWFWEAAPTLAATLANSVTDCCEQGFKGWTYGYVPSDNNAGYNPDLFQPLGTQLSEGLGWQAPFGTLTPTGGSLTGPGYLVRRWTSNYEGTIDLSTVLETINATQLNYELWADGELLFRTDVFGNGPKPERPELIDSIPGNGRPPVEICLGDGHLPHGLGGLAICKEIEVKIGTDLDIVVSSKPIQDQQWWEGSFSLKNEIDFENTETSTLVFLSSQEGWDYNGWIDRIYDNPNPSSGGPSKETKDILYGTFFLEREQPIEFERSFYYGGFGDDYFVTENLIGEKTRFINPASIAIEGSEYFGGFRILNKALTGTANADTSIFRGPSKESLIREDKPLSKGNIFTFNVIMTGDLMGSKESNKVSNIWYGYGIFDQEICNGNSGSSPRFYYGYENGTISVGPTTDNPIYIVSEPESSEFIRNNNNIYVPAVHIVPPVTENIWEYNHLGTPRELYPGECTMSFLIRDWVPSVYIDNLSADVDIQDFQFSILESLGLNLEAYNIDHVGLLIEEEDSCSHADSVKESFKSYTYNFNQAWADQRALTLSTSFSEYVSELYPKRYLWNPCSQEYEAVNYDSGVQSSTSLDTFIHRSDKPDESPTTSVRYVEIGKARAEAMATWIDRPDIQDAPYLELPECLVAPPTDPNVYINFDFENCLLTPEIQKGYSPNPTTGVNAFSGVGLIERAAEQAGDEFIPDRLEQFTAVNQLISLNPAGNILELVPLGINLVGTRLTPQLLELLLRGLIPDDDKYLAGHLESIEFILTDANGYQLGYIDPNGDYADLISSRNLSSIIDDMGLFNNIPNSHIWAEEYGQTSPIGLPKIEDISNQSTYCDADADALGGTGLDSWIQKITHFHIGLDNAVGNQGKRKNQ